MATRSIYKNVSIKDGKLGKKLISALENAQKFQGKEVTYSKKHKEIRKDQIKDIFGDM